MLITNDAIELSYLGQREEALAVAREAVVLYQELTRSLPEAFGRNLAISRNTLNRIQNT